MKKTVDLYHGNVMLVYQLDHAPHLAFLVFDDEAGDLVVVEQCSLFGQRLQRGETATAGLDLELAALSFAHDKVLQETSCCDIGFQLVVGSGIAGFAHIAPLPWILNRTRRVLWLSTRTGPLVVPMMIESR